MKHLKSYKIFELHQNTYDSYYMKRVLDIIRNKYSDIYNIDYDDIDLNRIFKIASVRGHIEVVKLLLNDSSLDPSDDNNSAIGMVSHYGHIEVLMEYYHIWGLSIPYISICKPNIQNQQMLRSLIKTFER